MTLDDHLRHGQTFRTEQEEDGNIFDKGDFRKLFTLRAKKVSVIIQDFCSSALFT